MTSVEFTHAAYFPYLLAGTVAIFTLYLLLVWRRNRKLRHRSTHNEGRIFGTFRLLLFALTVTLVGFGIGLLLLKPHVKMRETYPEYEPLHIVIASDASLSMLAQATPDPCGPSRRDVEIREVDAFMAMLAEKNTDRLGLVAFARFGHRVVPVLTNDYPLFMRVFRDVMDEDDIRNGFLQGTNHWDAALEATKIFRKDASHKRVLVILTDGEPDGPPDILAERRVQALKALSELGAISLYLIGVGDPETRYPIPLSRDAWGCPMEFYTQTEGEGVGQFMLTRPNVTELGILAEELGGVYRHSRTGSELKTMLNDVVMRERVMIGTKYRDAYHDLTTYVIYAILLLLVVAVTLKTP